MTAYLNDECVPPIPRTFSAAYHQHQNGVAEALWARLNTLTAIFIAAAPWLGIEFWTEAMEYANYSVVRRPSSANEQHAVPQSKFDGFKCRDDHLRQWGSVAYVHDDDASGFKVKARKGYLVGASKWHADGVFDIVMDDTKRVRQTMNVIFMEEGTISPDKMPDTLEFDLSDNSPMPINADHLHASFATNSHPGPNVASVDKIPFPFPPVAHCMGAGSTVPVRTSRCRFPLNAVLHTGNLSRCKSIHGKARCKALDGKTVLQALGMHYFVGGKYKQYTCSDLHYDCDKECLLVSSPAGVRAT